ncbi:MAG TPA: hypothetical protein VFE47_20995 [Tepidisphaeraceae bacterium]|jgi:hypothetical protein|nr:hypothetical protein [Tepidisphaeraceae bacterium]
MSVAVALRRFATRRHVRPWALCAPIIVLIISIPLLRPLHTPDPSLISDDEQSRLGTIQAIVEHHTLAIEGTDFRDTRDKIVAKSDAGEKFPAHFYSKQPPMLAALMSGPYWVMHRMGLTLGRDPSSTVFWLTLLCITLPVALSAGLVYRMSRIFEMKRPLRATLALVAVVGSGLISYSTVINAHAPAAALLLAAATLFIRVITHEKLNRAVGWLLLAGIFTALAATIDPPAVVFLILFVLVIGAFRWPILTRGVGIALYVLGAALPLTIHARLNRPITGDIRPGMFHPELALSRIRRKADVGDMVPGKSAEEEATSPSTASAPANSLFASSTASDDDDEAQTPWQSFLRGSYRVYSAMLGWHGIFSHFPVVLMGIIGVSLVMHRHWPAATKMLAGTTLGGALIIILIYAISRTTTRDAMFATRWFVVFLPLTIFWAGAWLRRSHRTTSWILAGILLAFSVTASLIGATGPIPRGGFDRYTVSGAWHNFMHPPSPPAIPSALADRGNQDAIPE